MRLSELQEGDKAQVVMLCDAEDKADQYLSNGFCYGSEIEVRKISRFHGMIYLTVNQRTIALRLSSTKCIEVVKV